MEKMSMCIRELEYLVKLAIEMKQPMLAYLLELALEEAREQQRR